MAITLESFKRSCRLCAEEQDVTIMIFSEEAEAMLLQNKLNKYLLIEVDEDDKLPKNICITCCTKLQSVCEFIDTARKAQEMLLNRSIMLDQIAPETCIITNVKGKAPFDSPPMYSHDDTQITEMEVSVDPMMVLQNSEDSLSPKGNDSDLSRHDIEDTVYLNGADGENVTIKLIKKARQEHCPEEEEKLDYNSKPFPCLICKRGFFTELALKNHSWIHTNEEKINKQFRCNLCEEGFDFKCDYITHLKHHRSQGVCQICGRMFRTEANLKKHMNVHVNQVRSFTCKVCGRSYNTRSNLRTHSITHSNDRPFKCHLCKKSFKRNQDLKFHINQHTGAKPYKCPFCDKSFASSGNCYSHRNRMHPGRRVDRKIKKTAEENQNVQPKVAVTKSPIASVKGIFRYQCQLCDHSFMKRDNFTYHMFQHTGEKPFQCSLCTEKFVTRRGLLLHHDKIHPGKERPLALISKNVLLK